MERTCFLAAAAAAAAAKSLQSCLTLCDPIDSSPPGSPVPGILQARTLGWVAISFSNAWKSKVKVKSLSCVLLLETPWTAAYQAPPSMGFSRQEYWSGVPVPSASCFPTNLKLLIILQFSSVQFSSLVQSCPTLCNPMNHSMLGLVDAIPPSHPLSSPSPPALSLSQHQSLFQWVNSSH